MKKRTLKLSALFVFSLLLLGMSLACYMWVRKEQRQYTLNRQLIAALFKKDTKQVLVLVEAGADPNTRANPAPAPSLPSVIKQFLHPAPLQANTSSTAFLMACSNGTGYPNGNDLEPEFKFPPSDPHLTHVMLLHGANVNTKDWDGGTALHNKVFSALYSSQLEYKTEKEIIQQLLAYGADPDATDELYKGGFGSTPMQSALAAASFNATPNSDLVALLRKYRKHP